MLHTLEIKIRPMMLQVVTYKHKPFIKDLVEVTARFFVSNAVGYYHSEKPLWENFFIVLFRVLIKF